MEKNKDSHFILIKRKFHHGKISILNIQVPNTDTFNFINKYDLLVKSQTDPSIVMPSDIQIPWTTTDMGSS